MKRSIASLSTSISAIGTFAPYARPPAPPPWRPRVSGNFGHGCCRAHAIIAPARLSGTSRHAKARDTLHAAGNAGRPSTTQTSAKGSPASETTKVARHAARRSRTSDPTRSSVPSDANKRRAERRTGLPLSRRAVERLAQGKEPQARGKAPREALIRVSVLNVSVSACVA
jgi:hypothetical protein